MVRRTLKTLKSALLVLLLLAAPVSLAAPTDCTEAVPGALRTCRTVNGWSGTYAGARDGLLFAYVVQGSASDPGTAVGAGSLAGAHARTDSKAVLVAFYASGLLSYDSVGVRFAHPYDTLTREMRVDAFVVHQGVGGSGDRGASWTARDADGDATPEQNRVETDVPYAEADVRTFKTSVAVRVLGTPVVMLAP